MAAVHGGGLGRMHGAGHTGANRKQGRQPASQAASQVAGRALLPARAPFWPLAGTTPLTATLRSLCSTKPERRQHGLGGSISMRNLRPVLGPGSSRMLKLPLAAPLAARSSACQAARVRRTWELTPSQPSTSCGRSVMRSETEPPGPSRRSTSAASGGALLLAAPAPAGSLRSSPSLLLVRILMEAAWGSWPAARSSMSISRARGSRCHTWQQQQQQQQQHAAGWRRALELYVRADSQAAADGMEAVPACIGQAGGHAPSATSPAASRRPGPTSCSSLLALLGTSLAAPSGLTST
jgi:hypothetical protein